MSPDVGSPTAAAKAANNGGSNQPHLDTQLLELLGTEIDTRARRVEELQEELATLRPELRRYEKMRDLLLGDAPVKPGPKGPRKKPGPKPGRKREVPAKIGPERLAEARLAITEYAAEHDEFRQTDIRAATGWNSGPMAMAFEQLRQDGMIRIGRVDGPSKYFRLTRAALREQS